MIKTKFVTTDFQLEFAPRIRARLLATGLLLLAILAGTMPVSAADKDPSMWPGTHYDAQIPTFKKVLGYRVGERITSHGDMLRYFDALQTASPDRIKVFEYGRTWEGRKLIYAAIGKPEAIENLAGLSSGMKRLTDVGEAQVDALLDSLPASVWLAYGVHGNEISSTDAAMMTAYHLLAARDEPVSQKIMANTVVFIDPLQNPDGRTRFIHNYYSTVGLEHSPDRLSAEQNEPWPSGRTNHYLFDMNRDWLAQTQPETRGRIKAINQYLPLVVIDLHEMGGDSSYYFAPAAKPFNPHMTETQIQNMSVIGENHARHFDRFGFDYFTREIFDAFYPGYGDSWPVFYGAAASTYEVASTRGEKYLRSDGELRTYIDPVRRHFVASLSTAESVSDNRKKLLGDFRQYQLDAVAAGKKDKTERFFIIPTTRDRAASHKLATLLARHGIEVTRSENSFKTCGKEYQAGTYIVDTAQPRGRYAKTVLTSHVDMGATFIKEQERLRARKLSDEIYDVTAWSLPLMFNLDAIACGKLPGVKSQVIDESEQLAGSVSYLNKSARDSGRVVAYLVPWGDMSAGRFLAAALRADVRIKSADKAFTLKGGTEFSAGTLIIETATNGSNLGDTISTLSASTGANVFATDTSWVIEGPNFGSENTVNIIAPRVAMAWDLPTNSLSAGNTRFVIERQIGYPVTAMRSNEIRSANLANYHVMILPSGDYESALAEPGAENIKRWIEQGGVLITLGSATRYASKAGLLATKPEDAVKEIELPTPEDPDKSSDTVSGQLIDSAAARLRAIENDKDQPDHVPGVLANVEVDQEHWLTAGVHNNVVSLVVGRDIYAPIKLAAGENVAWFKGAGELLASGYLYEENRKQLAYKPFLIHQALGDGMVISYTQEPALRGHFDGLNVLLVNTIFRSVAHANIVH